MEGRKKDIKDQRKKITRKEKRSKKEKFDKEKTFKMFENKVSLSKKKLLGTMMTSWHCVLLSVIYFH